MPIDLATEQVRVLVADDDRDTVESTALLLTLRGHTVQTARSGIEAVARTASFSPEIVLLDVAMPNGDGYEAARAIRALRVPVVPVIVAMTGYGRPDDKRRCAEAGFDLHLTKPLNVEVFDQLHVLLRDARSEEAQRARLDQAQKRAIEGLLMAQLEMAYTFVYVATTSTNEETRKRCVHEAGLLHDRLLRLLPEYASPGYDPGEALAALSDRIAFLSRRELS
jgi:CheY-like chemotaxis protein